MRFVGVVALGMTLFGSGCAKGVVAADATRLAEARVAATSEDDPLQSTRVQADGESKRLGALQQQLLQRLRTSEDKLLRVVGKAAAYDEEAAGQLKELQRDRLELSVALQILEVQRRQRAQDVVAGLVDAQPLEKDAAGEVTAASSASETFKRKPKADPLQARLADARRRIQNGESQFAEMFSMREMGPQRAADAPNPTHSVRSRVRSRGGRGDILSGAQPDDSERVYGATAKAERDEDYLSKPKTVSPKPAGATPSGVAAAAVVATGAAPDIAPALQAFLPRMQACIPQEIRRQGVAFTVRARLGADGSVRGARLSGGHQLSPSAAACVVDVMTQVRVSGGGGRIISVPLRISAR